MQTCVPVINLQIFHLFDQKTQFKTMELIADTLINAFFVRKDILCVSVQMVVFLGFLQKAQKVLVFREEGLEFAPPVVVISITDLNISDWNH